MKIARIEMAGAVHYAEVVGLGERFRLIEGDIFGEYQVTAEEVSATQARLLAPVEPQQIAAIGLNYSKHAKESGAELPKAPVLFIKTINTVTDPNEPILLPRMAPDEVDYECELAIVVSKKAKHVPESEADNYILGYTCANDVSARDCQLRDDIQWARGKCFDTFAPLGPWITTGLDPDNLSIRTILNGEVMQDSNTSDLIFPCRKLLSYVSECMTLYPGSIIITGTPSGVGMSRNPRVYLRDGDTVTIEIEGIGQLTNPVRSE